MKGEIACFGMYLGGPVCEKCTANRRCKALLVSNGFDLVSSMIGQLETTTPDRVVFKDTDRVTELVDQLLHPVVSDNMTAEEELAVLGVTKADLMDALDVQKVRMPLDAQQKAVDDYSQIVNKLLPGQPWGVMKGSMPPIRDAVAWYKVEPGALEIDDL